MILLQCIVTAQVSLCVFFAIVVARYNRVISLNEIYRPATVVLESSTPSQAFTRARPGSWQFV
jgi:hypothetical protein